MRSGQSPDRQGGVIWSAATVAAFQALTSQRTLQNYFSIQTTGTGEVNRPSLAPGTPALGKNGVISPVSVSTKNNDAGTSPTTINLAAELISILADTEKVWPMCAARCRSQLIGLSENNSLLVLELSSMKKGTQLFAAKPANRQLEHGPGLGFRFLRLSRLFAIRIWL